MSKKSDKALARFKSGYFCSQAVLTAFASDLGLDEETAMKIASGFGGGMGRMGEVCGAVSGAFMALGLHAWKAGESIPEEKNRVSERIRQFSERFRECHGSIVCRDLMGCDISTSEGYQQAADMGLFVSVCRPVVEDAAQILEDMLD